MAHGMAPPHKKRRLSPSPSHSTFAPSEPTATFAHSVGDLEHTRLSSAPARPKPHHVQEVHLQIQRRPAFPESDYRHGLHRRQDGTVTLESTITTVDAAGNTILSLVTNTLPTVTTPATSTSTSTSISDTEGVIGNGTGTGTSTSTSLTSSSSTSAQSTSLQSGSRSVISNSSTNGTTTHRSTGRTTTHATTQTSLRPVFLATLSDGDVKTITRSNKPYVTTFPNGIKTTICDRQGDCRISTTQNSDEQSTFSESLSPASESPTVTSSTAYIPGGIAGQSTAASPTSTGSTNSSNNDDNSTPPAGTIAGGVVGGAAGLAVILLIALIFLRWYKRRRQQGHQALPPSSTMSPDDGNTMSSRGPGMAERAGLMPFAAAVPALFRHQNRSSEGPPSSERGFTRVSGRKLPSAFSEGMDSGGMNSPPPSMPLNTGEGQNLSSQSFYRDSYGFYGGGGAAASTGEVEETPPNGPSPEEGPMEIALSPGPRRTPTIHTGGPYVMSPGSSVPATPTARGVGSPSVASPHVPALPGVARSETPTSFTDNRSSRFTEEV